MTSEGIKSLFSRLGRLISATEKKEGDETSWDYQFQDGEAHNYIL